MTMMTSLDLSNLGTTVGSTTGTGGNNTSDPQAMQDRFLKLLVAQINSQDPLNPMDNAQMTTQMAQINTVSGIQQLNETLKGMADQMASSQAMQGTTLIGKDALVEGDALAFDGSTGKGAFTLDGAASSVQGRRHRQERRNTGHHRPGRTERGTARLRVERRCHRSEPGREIRGARHQRQHHRHRHRTPAGAHRLRGPEQRRHEPAAAERPHPELRPGARLHLSTAIPTFLQITTPRRTPPWHSSKDSPA